MGHLKEQFLYESLPCQIGAGLSSIVGDRSQLHPDSHIIQIGGSLEVSETSAFPLWKQRRGKRNSKSLCCRMDYSHSSVYLAGIRITPTDANVNIRLDC